MPDILSVILRASSFVLLFQAAGVALFVAIFGRHLSISRNSIRQLGYWSALGGLVAVAGHYGLEAARATGELSGVFDASLQHMVLKSSTGTAFAFRTLGLVLIALGLRREDEWSGPAAVTGATVLALAFAFTGHTSAHEARWALAVPLFVHLIVVAFWFGALLPLYFASRQESPNTASQLIDAFSAAAVWLVPAIFVAGVVLAAMLVPNLAVFRQAYGQLLIAKGVGFAVLMGLATLNKWRFGPAMGRGEVAASLGFRRSVAAEYVLIVGVLTATATMTTFYSPE